MDYLHHDGLHRRAEALRREELRRVARLAGLKWRALLRKFHAPHPRQVPAPTHP